MMMWQVRVVRSVLRKSGKIFSGSSGSRFSSQVVQVNSLKLRERERESGEGGKRETGGHKVAPISSLYLSVTPWLGRAVAP